MNRLQYKQSCKIESLRLNLDSRANIKIQCLDKDRKVQFFDGVVAVFLAAAQEFQLNRFTWSCIYREHLGLLRKNVHCKNFHTACIKMWKCLRTGLPQSLPSLPRHYGRAILPCPATTWIRTLTT